MAHLLKKFALVFAILALALSEPPATANPVGDFFKKVGHTLSHLGKSPPPRRSPHKGESSEGDLPANKELKKTEVTPSPPPATSPTPTPEDIRPAALAPPDRKGRRDVPYGVAVPNKPGLVTSPYAPTQGFVDVHAFPSSTEVLDPFTGKIFLTP